MRQADGFNCDWTLGSATTGKFLQKRHADASDRPIRGGSHATSLLRNVL
ncbi:MAG: hypothetical protein IIC58_13575 [Proteobacteria bacterium]|nr:hypothetical protein [Pseudomonadota bacterium]